MEMYLADYRVVLADWSIPSDVTALEHVQPASGALCLVGSTTMGFTVNELRTGAEAHEKTCTGARTYVAPCPVCGSQTRWHNVTHKCQNTLHCKATTNGATYCRDCAEDQ